MARGEKEDAKLALVRAGFGSLLGFAVTSATPPLRPPFPAAY